MATKIIENVDEEQWRIFAGLCKIKNIIIGKELSKILEDYNKKNINQNNTKED